MEETIKNNRLIAEFMELPTEVFNTGILNYYYREYNSGTWYEEEELSYNISWDWLMPVVVKCFEVEEQTNDDLNFKLNDALLETNINGRVYGVVATKAAQTLIN